MELSMDCSYVFLNSSLFGERSACVWQNFSSVIIYYGDQAQLFPSMQIKTIEGSLRSFTGDVGYPSVSSPILLPNNPIDFEVQIEGPQKIGLCTDTVELTVWVLSGSGNRPIEFTWTVVNNRKRQGSFSGTSRRISLSSDLLPLVENTFTYSLLAVNYLGRVALYNFNVTRSPWEVPTIRVMGGNFLNIHKSSSINILAQAQSVDCFTDTPRSTVSDSWSLLDSTVPTNFEIENPYSYFLFIPPNTLELGEYTFLVKAFDSTSAQPNYAHVKIKIVPQAPQAIISGGNIIVSGSSRITLNSSQSIDPSSPTQLMRRWYIRNKYQLVTIQGKNAVFTTSLVSITAGDLGYGNFDVYLFVTNGVQSSFDSISILVSEVDGLPLVNMDKVPRKVLMPEKNKYTFHAFVLSGNPLLAYWNISGITTTSDILSPLIYSSSSSNTSNPNSFQRHSVGLSPPNNLLGTTDFFLTILTDSFLASKVESFSVRFTTVNENGTSWVEQSFALFDGPVSGVCNATPSTGADMTEFNFTCSGWRSQAPFYLRYSLRYNFRYMTDEMSFMLSEDLSSSTLLSVVPRNINPTNSSPDRVYIYPYIIDGDGGFTVASAIRINIYSSKQQLSVFNSYNLGLQSPPQEQPVIAMTTLNLLHDVVYGLDKSSLAIWNQQISSLIAQPLDTELRRLTVGHIGRIVSAVAAITWIPANISLSSFNGWLSEDALLINVQTLNAVCQQFQSSSFDLPLDTLQLFFKTVANILVHQNAENTTSVSIGTGVTALRSCLSISFATRTSQYEAPVNLSAYPISMYIEKVQPEDVSGQSYHTNDKNTRGAGVVLPSTSSIFQSLPPPSLSIVYQTVKTNPFEKGNLIADVVSVTILNGNQSVSTKSLPNQYTYNFTTDPLPTDSADLISCATWSASVNDWSFSECSISVSSSKQVTCQCNTLGDVSVNVAQQTITKAATDDSYLFFPSVTLAAVTLGLLIFFVVCLVAVILAVILYRRRVSKKDDGKKGTSRIILDNDAMAIDQPPNGIHPDVYRSFEVTRYVPEWNDEEEWVEAEDVAFPRNHNTNSNSNSNSNSSTLAQMNANGIVMLDTQSGNLQPQVGSAGSSGIPLPTGGPKGFLRRRFGKGTMSAEVEEVEGANGETSDEDPNKQREVPPIIRFWNSAIGGAAPRESDDEFAVDLADIKRRKKERRNRRKKRAILLKKVDEEREKEREREREKEQLRQREVEAREEREKNERMREKRAENPTAMEWELGRRQDQERDNSKHGSGSRYKSSSEAQRSMEKEKPKGRDGEVGDKHTKFNGEGNERGRERDGAGRQIEHQKREPTSRSRERTKLDSDQLDESPNPRQMSKGREDRERERQRERVRRGKERAIPGEVENEEYEDIGDSSGFKVERSSF